MAKKPDEIPDSRAVFYSVLWPSMRKAAIDCGWALALHGSLQSDMDLMAMPWTEDCKPHPELAKAISGCLGKSIWQEHHLIPHYTKPHGRIVYTLSIGSDWYIDLSLMPPHPKPEKQKVVERIIDPTNPPGFYNSDGSKHWCEMGCPGPHYNKRGTWID